MSKDEGPFSTFSEAFTNFWPRFVAMVKDGAPEQALSWCWIMGTFDDGDEVPLLWEDAKIFAYEVGLLVGNGELQEPAPEVDPQRVEIAFRHARIDMAIYEIGVGVEILVAKMIAGSAKNPTEDDLTAAANGAPEGDSFLHTRL
jgi:hypothetical protein